MDKEPESYPMRLTLRPPSISFDVDDDLLNGVLVLTRQKTQGKASQTQLLQLLYQEAHRKDCDSSELLLQAMVDYWTGLWEQEKNETAT